MIATVQCKDCNSLIPETFDRVMDNCDNCNSPNLIDVMPVQDTLLAIHCNSRGYADA